jgi:hypothetical protein
MPDLFEAFRKNGLAHAIPKHARNHTSFSHSQSFSASQRHISPLQHAMLKDHARYQQTVPPEWRYGTSYQNAMQPMSQSEFKQLHTTASAVFDHAMHQLGEFEAKARNRW